MKLQHGGEDMHAMVMLLVCRGLWGRDQATEWVVTMKEENQRERKNGLRAWG